MKLWCPGFSIFFDRFQSCSKALKHLKVCCLLPLLHSLLWRWASFSPCVGARQLHWSRGDANLQTTPLPTFHDIPIHSHYIHLYPLYSLAYFHSTTCFLGLSALWMALLCRRCLCLTRWIVVRFCWFESGMTCWFLANVRFHVPPASHRQTFGGSAAAAGAASVLGVPGVDEPGTKPKEVKLWTLKLCNCVKLTVEIAFILHTDTESISSTVISYISEKTFRQRSCHKCSVLTLASAAFARLRARCAQALKAPACQT